MGFIIVWLVFLVRYLMVLRRRFRTERERQLIVTRPRVKARLGGSTLVSLPEAHVNNEKTYLAKLIHPYHFYQQAKKMPGVGVAPGEMTLDPKQRKMLEAALVEHEEVYTFIDPDGVGEAFLTPGPQLFSWAYILKTIGVVSLTTGLCLWAKHEIAMLVFLYTGLGVLYYQLGERYTVDLDDWIKPVKETTMAEQVARPQVQEEVAEAMELRELADNPLKLEDL
ncbi:hypothetical protein [Neolewinella persica]|uniref:hypothetical protein n=1 Tax=Neolewinella persica TaxID=70998 RepID=UPI00035DD6BE|nr:hypothetical protein [Neolewinella persica]